MHYEGTIIRPPSEAFSIILQVTVGCSHNRCTFCGAYREVAFRLKEETSIDQDLDFAATYCRRQTTLFLADGDALIIPQERLLALLTRIKEKMPWVRRVSLYANCRDILRRSASELRSLRHLGLGRIYMGLESGHDQTLRAIGKGATSREMILAGQRVREAGIFLSVTTLLGIAGMDHSVAHARASAAVLNQMQPQQIAILTLMVLPNTPLAAQVARGTFQLPDKRSLLLELQTLVDGLAVSKAQFQANHASNYLALDGRLPRDKAKFLRSLEQALSGELPLTPEFRRCL